MAHINIWKIVTINIFLVISFASGVVLKPHFTFSPTPNENYFRMIFVEFDVVRCLV